MDWRRTVEGRHREDRLHSPTLRELTRSAWVGQDEVAQPKSLVYGERKRRHHRRQNLDFTLFDPSNGLPITRAENRGNRCMARQRQQRRRFIGVLCRLAADAPSLLLKHFGNSPQRFVHLLSGSKFPCDVCFQDNHVSTRCIFRDVLAPHTFAEVIFRAHFVRGSRVLPFSWLLHNFFVQPVAIGGLCTKRNLGSIGITACG